MLNYHVGSGEGLLFELAVTGDRQAADEAMLAVAQVVRR